MYFHGRSLAIRWLLSQWLWRKRETLA
jgi:hypothetical protein